ncbi:MAG: hypothetical protein J0H69_00620 [Burkholderiales bacterium]|nr:hypothetical protein [Burkholderiales bacterium]
MSTYTFDDGSTITMADNGSVSSTPAPTGYLASDYWQNFQPSNVSSGASSWMDVLKFGIGRVADYKTASMAAQNTPATYVPIAVPQQGVGISGNTILLLGGAALIFVLMSSMGKKG